MRAPRSESRKHLTQDFRVEAVRLAETRERSRRRHVAEDLGVGLSTLRTWIDRGRDWRRMEHPPDDRQEDMAAELKRPRRENEVLRQEGTV